MHSWNEVLLEIEKQELVQPNAHDHIRRLYLKKLYEKEERNVISYYSGWLQKPDLEGTELVDNDMNGFMITVKDLDPEKGLDLILHTPGGDPFATEGIVGYLHGVFKNNIRAIIPQLAMSAGTMIACACKQIIMGMHSSIGPIDPQFGGVPASGLIDEFNRAQKEVQKDPSMALLWQLIIRKYHPTLLGECKNAMEWAEEIVKEWLEAYMFAGVKNNVTIAKKIAAHLCDHARLKNHGRHLLIDECKKIKLNVRSIEDEDFADLVFAIHRLYMHTFTNTNAVKIIENHLGESMIIYETN
jgi:ATP-dependent protease ClpP protease subunit